MVENGQKMVKMVKNGQKWYKIRVFSDKDIWIGRDPPPPWPKVKKQHFFYASTKADSTRPKPLLAPGLNYVPSGFLPIATHSWMFGGATARIWEGGKRAAIVHRATGGCSKLWKLECICENFENVFVDLRPSPNSTFTQDLATRR